MEPEIEKGTEMDVVTRAERLARAAHAGQVDKSGAPYVGHVERVSRRVAHDPTLAAVAWLHDTIEDCEVSADDLRAAGMPDEVVDAVVALTRVSGEPPEEYYGRVRANALALPVKLADIADNTDPERAARLDAPTRERLARKYAHARAMLADG